MVKRMKMKKYIQSMMAFAAIVSFASCSSEDNNTTIENESAVKVMTFTATQEGNEASTRAILSGTNIHWESEDEISLLYSSENKQFTLTDGAGSTSGKFSGEAEQSTSYTAVYPYQSEATLSGTSVEKVTLKATQNATANSFDKEAALMIAEGGDGNTLNFKNVVGYVKVKPTFNCTRIDLKAFDNSAVLAGTGTVSYNNGEPKLDLSNAETKNDAITLTGDIKAGNYYYIAVPPVTLKAGWTIEFTAKDNGKLYSRKGTNPITFTRNKVTDLGEFATTGDYWYDPVRADQEVDLGLTITIGTKNYKVIFAKSNLTTTGLATNEYDYGDYFAWGAIKPWYTEIDKTSSSWTATWEKSGGYSITNAPFYNSSTESYTKYTPGDALEASDDAARQILKGDWRIPTTEIWAALVNNSTKVWDSTNKGYEFTKNSQTLFLPAAGNVWETSFENVGSSGRYWSGTTASLNRTAYYLHFGDVNLNAQDSGSRNQGFPVRPVRLVEVSQSQQ